MTETDSTAELLEPGLYEIRIKGRLDDLRWADWFQGMTIAHPSDRITLLSGRLTDQAALHGVLSQIRDLGIPILSVQNTLAMESKEQQMEEIGECHD
jgi:hypothetical protein